MSAHSLPLDLDRALRNGFFNVADPRASGTFGWEGNGAGVASVITLAAENRALPAAASKAVGTMLLVIFQKDGGDLTLTGAQVSVVLQNAGEAILFIVTQTKVGSTVTNVWKVMADSRTESASFGARTVDVPLASFRVFDAMQTNLPLEATADDSDDFGMRTATIGTTAGALTMKATNATTAPQAVALAVVPADYIAGSPLSVVIRFVREDAATTSATLDLKAYRNAAPTVDVCATAAQDINSAASGTATFVLTPTNILPGESILLNLVGAIVDDTTSLFSFPRITWSYTV